MNFMVLATWRRSSTKTDYLHSLESDPLKCDHCTYHSFAVYWVTIWKRDY